jgi:hypothetical protein
VAKCAAVRDRLIFAMKVTEKMTLREYDAYTSRNLRGKIPDLKSRNPKRRVGDSIFSFPKGSPRLRPNRHSGNKETLRRDLKGKFALLSDYFFYFGDKAISIPRTLQPIIPNRGHRSVSNAPYLPSFVRWIEKLRFKPNILYGEPSTDACRGCSVPKRTRVHPQNIIGELACVARRTGFSTYVFSLCDETHRA